MKLCSIKADNAGAMASKHGPKGQLKSCCCLLSESCLTC